MYRVLFFLCIIFSSLNAQSLFFNDPVVSGTPLIPSNDLILKYLDELKINNPASFEKITSTAVLPQNVGDEYDFNVLNLKNPNSPKLEEKTFVLKIASAKINIWVEKAELENNHVTDGVILTIYNGLMENTPFSSIEPQQGIFEIESAVYGSPPDIDGNGKVEFLLTDIKDSWEGDGTFIGGFFYPNDQSLSFPGSNKADILYVDTYPGIFQDNQYNTYRALGSVAHELQHLIQYNYDRTESSWVNEGLSELASYLCGYGLRSPGKYLENTALSMISWNDNESLPHYSKVALWTYFLYEKYGLAFISQLSQTAQSGIDGFNQALQNAGFSQNFQDVLLRFFKTLAANDPQETPDYIFELADLQFLKSIPAKQIRQYPTQAEFSVGAYSMKLLEFTNGDSLAITFENPFKFPVYINKTGFGSKTLLIENAAVNIFDADFGQSHHTQTFCFANISSSSDAVSYKADSRTRYDIFELKYDSNSLTHSISSFNSNLQGTTNAIQYISPRDTALLKSVRFFNKSAHTDLRIHLYDSQLGTGKNPVSQSFIVQNVVINDWVTIDVEDYQVLKSENQTFDVGIEFLTDGAGAMGYENVSGSSHINKSFVKGYSNQNIFFYLNQYQINGVNLDGSWMIRLELAAPFTGTGNASNAQIESAIVYPQPFSPARNAEYCTIEYELDNPGPVDLKIYNILGQQVFSGKDTFGSGLFLWDGKNNYGQWLASGFYLVRLSTKKDVLYKRLLIIR